VRRIGTTVPQPTPTAGDTGWFTRDRFGMLVRWRLLALPARHEWVVHRESITN
jgi:alpha-L-fucosidase